MKKEEIKNGTIFYNGYQNGMKQCHLIYKINHYYAFTIGLCEWNGKLKLNTEELWYKKDLEKNVFVKIGETKLEDMLKPFLKEMSVVY